MGFGLGPYTLPLAGRKLANCVVIIGSDCAQKNGTLKPKHRDVFLPCARGIWPPWGAQLAEAGREVESY